MDDGWLATMEFRFALRPEMTLFAFIDAARGDQFHDPRPFDGDLSRNLRRYL